MVPKEYSASDALLSDIGQIAVTAHDLRRAVAFYRDTLGLRFLFEVPKMAFLQCGGVRLMLAEPEKPEYDHPASLIYYRVEDMDHTHAVLQDRGVKFLSEPQVVHRTERSELWMAFLNDSEGNTLALMTERTVGA